MNAATGSGPGGQARLCRYEDTRHYVWGDDVAGRIKDWYYAGSGEIHMSMWALPPGGWFRHSEQHKSYYLADEAYLVLAGEMTIHNPETGDVAVVRAGEGLAFRERTWHHGYNTTGEETMLIGILAPVPDDIAAAADLAAAVPPLDEVRMGRWDLLSDFPWNAAEAVRTSRFRVLPRADWLHIMAGDAHPLRIDLVCATDRLTAGLFTLLPGFIGDQESHPGDMVAFCVDGQAAVHLPDSDDWLELGARDGCFIPAGARHRWFNTTGRAATVFFGVAPRYR
jgi:quercetin dioxygenase-like cupin family protein